MRRPEEIKDQLGNIEQIETVVVAMRALAAAHSSEARRHLTAIREYEATVAGALGAALALFPDPDALAGAGKVEGRLAIVVGASQGFSGAYSERLVAAALSYAESADVAFMLIGQRCISEFAAHGRQPIWSAEMVSHCAEVPALASRINDALFAQLDGGEIGRVSIIFADPGPPSTTIVERGLMPLESLKLTRAREVGIPLITLAPQVLSTGLVAEYVFSTICEGLILGFAAENYARMEAMSRARGNVRLIREDLRSEFAQSRQEQTTTEIVELSEAVTQIGD